MRAPSCCQPAKPFVQSSACALAKSAGDNPFLRASSSLIQGWKSSPLRDGERQHQIAEVALGIDDDGGNVIDGRFFEKRETEAGLAAAGHADADRMGHQILRIVQQPARLRLFRGEIIRAADIKDAELFEILCGGWGSAGDGVDFFAALSAFAFESVFFAFGMPISPLRSTVRMNCAIL